MRAELEYVLEELANRFEMAGDTTWTTAQIADALRRFIHDPDAPLTNRNDQPED